MLVIRHVRLKWAVLYFTWSPSLSPNLSLVLDANTVCCERYLKTKLLSTGGHLSGWDSDREGLGWLALGLWLWIFSCMLMCIHSLLLYLFMYIYHTAYSFKTALILIDIFRSWSLRKWASGWRGSWGVPSRGRASTWRTRSLTGRCHNTTAHSAKRHRWKWIAHMWWWATTSLLISISTKAVLATYISSPHLLTVKQWLCIKPLLALINTVLLLLFMPTAILQDQALSVIWNKMFVFFPQESKKEVFVLALWEIIFAKEMSFQHLEP